MKKIAFALLLVITFACHLLIAQEYDTDSVYYTRIAKPLIHPAKAKPAPFRDTVKHSPFFKYSFQVNTGASMGCHNCATGQEYTFSLSTIHGSTMGRKLWVGGGAGFDSYPSWQTLPVFGNVSFDLFGTRNTHALFVQAQYGKAFGWYNQQPQEYGLKEEHGGTYMAAHLGYRIKYHDLKISFLVGFKKQNASTYYEYPTYITDATGKQIPSTPNTLTNNREMQRFTMLVGFGWK